MARRTRTIARERYDCRTAGLPTESQPHAEFPLVLKLMGTTGSIALKAAVFIAQVVAMSCILGIGVDLVTAHVAVEYFTVHHPHVVDSNAPLVMALVWGIGASWWCGLILAPLLWWANVRRHDPLPPRRLLVMVAKAMGLVWLIMMLALLGAYLLIGLIPIGLRRASFESDRRLMAVAAAHMLEYVLAVVMTVVLCFRIARVKV